MLFDLLPKERRDELFGRDGELEYLLEQLPSGNWVVIGRQREMGKTSLVKVVIRELMEKHGFRGFTLISEGLGALTLYWLPSSRK